MRLKRYLPALILTLALFPVSCSVYRTRNQETRALDEARAAARETESLRQQLLSIREEIWILERNSGRKTERTEAGAGETVTERYDTSGRLLSRTTERYDNSSRTTVDETYNTRAGSAIDSTGMLRTEVDGERTEAAESRSESETLQKEETVPAAMQPWWQRGLMYCGIAAILWIILRLFKPHLKGILTTIKTIVKLN